jgi:hypothetical protein
MKEVELEHLCFDANKIESQIEVDDNDAFVCEVTDYIVQSRMYRALPGWSPPYAPADWGPTVNTNKGEPLFEDLDDPGGWTHIFSDQCLNQEVENTSVMPCLLAHVLFLWMQ